MYKIADFSFETKNDLDAAFKITLLNDTVSAREDRNSFIKTIHIHTAEK